MRRKYQLHYGIGYHTVSRRVMGHIQLYRGERKRPIKVTLYDARLDWTMKIEVEPSYAVNPPYMQYERTAERPYDYWRNKDRKLTDLRMKAIESNIRRALTAHGEYATEVEIRKILAVVPRLLNLIDKSPEMPPRPMPQPRSSAVRTV